MHGVWAPAEAAVWTSALVLPLAKGPPTERVKLRPIALGDALVKLAVGVAVDCVGDKLRRWAEPDQLSIRTPDGAGLLVKTLQSLVATAGAKYVLLQGDIANAR